MRIHVKRKVRNMKNKLMNAASKLTAVAMVATMFATSLPAGAAEATDRSITFGRLAEGATTSATLVWTSAQAFGDTDAWSLSESSFTFSGISAAAFLSMTGSTNGPFNVDDVSCSGGDYALTAAATSLTLTGCPGGNEIANGETVTVEISGNLVLPSNAGTYTLSLGGVISGSLQTSIVDDDQVTVTGNVSPTMTFDLDVSIADANSSAPYTVDFGTVAPGTPEISDNSTVPSIWIDLATNATDGATVTVQSLNQGLLSASTTDEIETVSANSTLTLGGEFYGICVDQVNGWAGTTRDGGGTDWDVPAGNYASTCDGTGSSVIGELTSGPTNLLVANNPLTGGRAQVRVGVSVDNATPAHPDYADTLTFLATATY
jgi:hypothetical protein